MKSVSVISSVIVLAVSACGVASSKSKTKDSTSIKSSYDCTALSILDSTVQPSHIDWSESFEFSSTDTNVSKNVGVTSGDSFAITVARQSNSEGDRINLAVINVNSKATSVAQVEEGAKSPMLSTSTNGKDQIAIICKKK